MSRRRSGRPVSNSSSSEKAAASYGAIATILKELFKQVDGRWYGDGGIRLTAPLSPALHLGATKVLAVSTRYGRTREELIGAKLDDFIGAERAQADWEGFLTPERIQQIEKQALARYTQDAGNHVSIAIRSAPLTLP